MHYDAQLMRCSFKVWRGMGVKSGNTQRELLVRPEGLVGVTVWTTKYPCVDLARKAPFPVC
jgi:hypothetical protein